ncbi:MAG TPA: cbb3-type cytochrome c oxidase subunit I [Candidatus Bathyarchaeia archaeon]|nr:cbb3-type cytochrome c oxidase subunit I [Candidatus Bathyarchaeia archaeon]
MTSEHGHGEQKFIWKYVFSVDHKTIGIQYLVTSFTFLFIGLCMMLLMRWQLAQPDQPFPVIGDLLAKILGDDKMPTGVMLPEFYNQLGAMHGTIMIFLGVVPLGVGAFGNFVLPLQIGAPDMAFPRLNMMSYWVYLVGGFVMLSSFLFPGGAAQSGWTSYAPLSVIAPPGQTVWCVAMVIIITSSLFGAINFIVTTLNMRAPGMTWSRLPVFVWAQLVTAVLLLLAFPVLEAGALLQLLDRVAGTSFYIPKDLVVGATVFPRAGGGNPILWQHLFWFLAHPEVYVLLLPAMGIVAEIIATNTRKPLFGYREMVGSMCLIGVLSFVVWAHHMFLSGMRTSLANLFVTTTLTISVPSVAILTCLLLSLRGGSIRFNTPMLFALAFLPMFGIGGLTGLPLGFAPTDLHLHDTYYVIGHFHYVVAPGSLIALMGGLYYWYPKMFGRQMNRTLGKIHFWLTIIGMNGVFFPMFIQGMAGMQRRLADPTAQTHNLPVQWWSIPMGISAAIIFIGQFPFIFNFFMSLRNGEKVGENPWEATTLEWACPSPPPHGNFVKTPEVHRGPYEYSVPGRKEDYWPQDEAA